MKIIVYDAYYHSFLDKFYQTHDTERLGFETHRSLLMEQRMGTTDSYSFWMNKLGHDAQEIIANDNRLQLKWARENGVMANSLPPILDKISRKLFSYNWRLKVIQEQVSRLKPDVILVQEGNILTDEFIKELKGSVRLIIGQLASPLDRGRTYRSYDLMLTSFPHFVSQFKAQGIPSAYFRLGFEERVLDEVGKNSRTIPVSFVGGYDRAHGNGTDTLEALGEMIPVQFYGYGVEKLGKESPIHKNYYGEVWGLQMFQVLSKSRITLNRHINVSENYANNMRLYEATGMGCCLVTDWKENLGEMFEPEKEVVTYKSREECIERIKWLTDHPDESRAIAERGKARVLKEHTYKDRMIQLNELLHKYLKK